MKNELAAAWITSALADLKCELDTDLLTDLDALYIDARYPGDLGLLPDGKPTLENAHDFYDIAGKIFNLVNSRDMLL
jgi:HEPN domain-containing protein